MLREKLSELLGEKIREIVELMDKQDYTPKLTNYSELSNIYATEYNDVQPFLFRVTKIIFFYSCFNLSIFI